MQTVTVSGKGAKMLKLSDGSFVGVSKPLTLDQFEKGSTYDVEIKENGKFKNIVSLGGTTGRTPVNPVGTPPPFNKAPGRDFDKENRGKTRCVLMEALLSNPNVVDASTKDIGQLTTLVDMAVKYVFGD